MVSASGRLLYRKGIDRKTIIEDLSDSNIPVTMGYIKQVVWFHFMVGMFGVDSTTKLDTTLVTKVEQAVARHLRDIYGMTISWPSQESQSWEAMADIC